MIFSCLIGRGIALLPVIALAGGCGNRDASQPATTAETVPATPPVAGIQTFVIVPARSQASYHATEEFFPAALAKLGIKAGKTKAVGTTQAVEGRFRLDPERPTTFQLNPERSAEAAGENTFTVRLNTLTSNQKKRDDYLREIRDDGPSFDAYPLATFKATAIGGDSTPNASGRELNLRLTGDLTIRQITKRVIFDAKVQLTGDTLTGVATTHLLLSDFGIGPIDFPPLLAVADPIDVDLEFTARAQPK